MRAKNLLKSLPLLGINLVIFYYLIVWCSENIRLDLFSRQFSQIPLKAVALTIILNLTATAFYALRLGVMINLRFQVSLPAIFLGFGLNTVLPFRLGEIAKLYYAKRYFRIPATSLFSATLVEKLFDLSALAVLATLFVTLTSIVVIPTSIFIALIVVVIIGFTAVLGYRKFAHRLERSMGASARVQALIAALHVQSQLNHLRRIVCYTLVIWALNIMVVYAGLSTFLPDYPIGVLDAIALLLILAVAIAIPTAPAGIGLFEAGIVAYLSHVREVPNELALAAAVVLHIAMMLPHLVAVSWIMIRQRPVPGDEVIHR